MYNLYRQTGPKFGLLLAFRACEVRRCRQTLSLIKTVGGWLKARFHSKCREKVSLILKKTKVQASKL